MKQTIIRFFVGKGGVGKTTCAAAYALRKAREGYRTLIVSLDPAHNLGDVFNAELGDEPRTVENNLIAIEVDYDAMIRKHLKSLSEKIKDIYGYLRILNLDKYIDVLKHAPGIEEQAALDRITEIVRKYVVRKSVDVLVFDTPPTGLTLRIMALPAISLIWISKLMELRLAILDRRKAIAKVLGEKSQEVVVAGHKIELPIDIAEDPIFQELKKLYEEYSTIHSILTNKDVSSVIIVVNPETLPIVEAKRAYDFLSKLGISVSHLIVNKILKLHIVSDELKQRLVEQEKALSLVRQLFSGIEVIEIPYLSFEPRGIEALEKIAQILKGME